MNDDIHILSRIPAIEIFYPIGLDHLKEGMLLDRKEQKFLFHRDQLPGILELFSDDYFMLEIDDRRIHQYHTLYFDTPDYQYYMMHHNGKKNRWKFRIREYKMSSVSFFEIKSKTNKGYTEKYRTPQKWGESEISQEIRNWMIGKIGFFPDGLRPSISTHYYRITMIGKDYSSRITIDTNIGMKHRNKIHSMENLCILEIKYNNKECLVKTRHQLKDVGIRPQNMSKYCLGVASLIPKIKKNNFLDKKRRIDKICTQI